MIRKRLTHILSQKDFLKKKPTNAGGYRAKRKHGTFKNPPHLWDVHTGTHKQAFKGPAPVYCVAFSPDGKTLAEKWGTGKYTTLLYDALGGWEDIHLWDAHTGERKRILEGHTLWVRSVAFSPDGQTLASGSGDDTIRLWEVHTGKLTNILIGHADGVISVAFSPDGKTLASGGGDGTLRLWNAHTGTSKITPTGHTDWVNSVAFSPDGKILASGSRDGNIHLWDADTGEHKKTLTGHTFWVESLAFSPDGKTLASGSLDSTVLLWELFETPPPTPR